MKSWKTTTAGVLMIVAALSVSVKAALLGQPVDYLSVGGQVAAGIGLIAAKDHATQ